MKRDIYEYLKEHPTTWFTVEDLAKHFDTDFEHARNAISRCFTAYGMIEQKKVNERLFVKFDKARFDMQI